MSYSARRARVFVQGRAAATLEEVERGRRYRLVYDADYEGTPVSLTMPVGPRVYDFHKFPPFFEGLLPEGVMLDALIRQLKIDANDYFGQLLAVGRDMVGAVTVEEINT